MTEGSQQQQQLLDEASEWLVCLCSGQRSEQQEHDFALWLSRSDAHKDAFDQTESLWQDLAIVQHFPNVDESPELPQAANDATGGIIKRRGFLATAAAALLAVSSIFLQPALEKSNTEAMSYRTDVGEQEKIALSDGSSLYLNTSSRVSVSYSENQRYILLEQGEAYFDVAKDKSRPFVVEIPNGTVTAVGTAFNIHVHDERTDVRVTEGVVKVMEQSTGYGPLGVAIVRADQAIEVSASDKLGSARAVDNSNVAAWTEKKLIFQNTNLHEVISALNRYSTRTIKIGDPSIASRKVSGVFRLDQPQAVLEGIEASLGLAHEEHGDLIMLYQSKKL